MVTDWARHGHSIGQGWAAGVLRLCHRWEPQPESPGFGACYRDAVVLKGLLGRLRGSPGQHGVLHYGAAVQAGQLAPQVCQLQVLLRAAALEGATGGACTSAR